MTDDIKQLIKKHGGEYYPILSDSITIPESVKNINEVK